MVRSTKRKNNRRGGGWSQGPALSQQAYYVPEYKMYSECYPMDRPGMIQSNPNPALAQTPMAGGGCGVMRGGAGCGVMRGGCGCMMRGGKARRRSTRRSRTGTCGYYGARGGAKKTGRKSKKTTRRQRGGRYGIDVGSSVGGDGPNVAPVTAHVPCEAYRPMPINPTSAMMLTQAPNPDVMVGSLRPAYIQAGGAAYTPAPLAYTAPRAGFTFYPNIAQGQVLNPGQIPYEEVVPQHDGCGATCGSAIAAINK